jgi:hypothetical protein
MTDAAGGQLPFFKLFCPACGADADDADAVFNLGAILAPRDVVRPPVSCADPGGQCFEVGSSAGAIPNARAIREMLSIATLRSARSTDPRLVR